MKPPANWKKNAKKMQNFAQFYNEMSKKENAMQWSMRNDIAKTFMITSSFRKIFLFVQRRNAHRNFFEFNKSNWNIN